VTKDPDQCNVEVELEGGSVELMFAMADREKREPVIIKIVGRRGEGGRKSTEDIGRWHGFRP